MEQKSIILVLGMHRSGTSATTCGLQALQVGLGKTLIPGIAHNNDKGFWEDADINQFNNSLLKALNREWHTLSPLAAETTTGPAAQAFLPQAIDLLSHKLDGFSGIWGMKDPRFCQLLPFWQQVFNHLQLQVGYILACRHPKSVAQSLAKRDGFDLQKGYYLWQEHVLLSLNYTLGQTRLVVDFDNLLADPIHQLSRISKTLNLPLNPDSAEVQNYTQNFLEGKLRHTRYLLLDLYKDEFATPLIVELYRVFKDLADDRVSFSDPHIDTTIKQLTQQFHEVTHLLTYVGICDDRATQFATQLEESQEHIATLQQNVSDLDEQVLHLNQAMDTRDRHIGDLNQAIQERDLQGAELQAMVQERDQVIADRDQELVERAQALAEQERILAERDHTIAEQDQALAEQERILAERDHTIAEQDQALAERSDIITQRELAIDRLTQQLATQDTAIARLSQECMEQGTVIADLQQQLMDRQAEVTARQQQLSSREAEIIDLTSRLDQTNAELLAIHQSISWQIFAPLRKINTQFPRLAKVNRQLLKYTWWTLTLQLPNKLFPWAKFQKRFFRDIRIIRKSGLLDVDWYLTQYPDVARAALTPMRHYLQFGAKEGRDPNPLFDTDWYLSQYPDVAQIGVNPLRHYIQYGVSEGRDPNPLFDTDWYLSQYPDVAQAKVNPLYHYLYYGAEEGRDPSPQFDSDWYLDHYPDVAKAEMNPLRHYLWYGQAEGRNPLSIASELCLGGVFDQQFYQATCLAECHSVDLTRHYLNQGMLRGNSPNQRIMSKRLERQPSKPLISILMPTYNTPASLLTAAINSIQQQVYENWELCIQDDGSTSQETLQGLNHFADIDPRIHINFSPSNQGISVATNAALDIAKGEFIAMMDHDDLLTPNSLAEIIAAHNQHPDADVFYTDQACVDESGQFTQHHYKPDWSPWMFRGVMYVGHLLVVRRRVVQAVGGFDSRFDFIQDFEFMLRVSEVTQHIVHVPKILYFWRQTAESIAGGGKTDIDFGDLQSRAVNAHCERLKLLIHATPNPVHPHRLVLEPASTVEVGAVRVLIMPPSIPQSSLSEPSLVERLANETDTDGVSISWIQLQPEAMEDASGLVELLHECQDDVWVFINSQCQPAQADWLKRLARYVSLPGVGAVGPLMVGSTGQVASAGMVLSKSGAKPVMQGFDPQSDGYAGSLSCLREVSALSPDCIALRRQVLTLDQGFFPEFGLAYNLLDVGLRCQQAGLTTLYIPFIQMQFMANAKSCLETNSMSYRFWSNYRSPMLYGKDSFYSPNLSTQGDYALPISL
jgi:hypothetical protein